MTNLEQLQAQAREILAQAKEAQAAAEAAQAAQLQEQMFQAESGVRTANLMGDYVFKQADQGNLDVKKANSYFHKVLDVKGLEAAQNEYLRLAASLLNHKHTGVETKTARFGNGGLTWRGKSYSGTQELYQDLQEAIGDDPFGNKAWLEEILDLTFEDPGALDLAMSSPDRFTSYANLFRKATAIAKQPFNVPDLSQVTQDDALELSAFFGIL